MGNPSLIRGNGMVRPGCRWPLQVLQHVFTLRWRMTNYAGGLSCSADTPTLQEYLAKRGSGMEARGRSLRRPGPLLVISMRWHMTARVAAHCCSEVSTHGDHGSGILGSGMEHSGHRCQCQVHPPDMRPRWRMIGRGGERCSLVDPVTMTRGSGTEQRGRSLQHSGPRAGMATRWLTIPVWAESSSLMDLPS